MTTKNLTENRLPGGIKQVVVICPVCRRLGWEVQPYVCEGPRGERHKPTESIRLVTR